MTISGYASNGAIIHYKAAPTTAAVVGTSSLYLCDSGGQYLDGMTLYVVVVVVPTISAVLCIST